MPSFTTLQITGLFISGGLLITALLLFNCTRQMKAKIRIIEMRIDIEAEIEEKLDLYYNEEFEYFDLEENQSN